LCLFNPPQMPRPAAPPPPPDVVNEVDPAALRAREDAKKRAAAMSGYSGTIATSGLGVTTPAPLTTSGGKALLGQ